MSMRQWKDNHNNRLLWFAIAVIGFVVVVSFIGDVKADIGLLVDEYTKGGSRFCIYDVAGEEVIITVDYADLCPVTVDL